MSRQKANDNEDAWAVSEDWKSLTATQRSNM
jgi:hypothetical protein